MQLMQPYVQKSRSTTLPLSAASVSGLSVLSQPRPPVNSGARTRIFSCADMIEPFLEFRFGKMAVEIEEWCVNAGFLLNCGRISRLVPDPTDKDNSSEAINQNSRSMYFLGFKGVGTR